MARLIDMTGMTFGAWTVIRREPSRGISTMWLCQCSCGKTAVRMSANLKKSVSKCKHSEFGLVDSLPEYSVWKDMKSRCTRPSNKYYHRYGGRGISVCDEWSKSFLTFLRDVGRRPSADLSIDRINNDGNYQPGNVRWATRLASRPLISTRLGRERIGYLVVRAE